ncbi:Tn7-like transposition protein D [compost metagenome]
MELGLSVTYVYRVIRDSDRGGDRWKEARFAKQLSERRHNFEAEYPSHLAHECRDYPWLYRNDRQWLSEHVQERSNARSSRQKHTEGFHQVDCDLAAAVISCAEELRARPGKPVFISRTKIGRELHALSRFEKQLNKLPRCAAALAMVCESIEEFHSRRLKWAAKKLRLEGRPITRSSLFRMANIRPLGDKAASQQRTGLERGASDTS